MHLVVGGTNVGGQGDVASSPRVANDSNTDANVVDGLFQSQTGRVLAPNLSQFLVSRLSEMRVRTSV